MRASRMMMMLLGLVLLLADLASAATLHGNIYDIELNELNNVIVEVDSEPKQRYVSKDGAYLFKLNAGDYVITANYSPDGLHEYTATENVTIKKEGDYVYDIFLFPDFDDDATAFLKEQDVVDVSDTVIESEKRDLGTIVAVIAAVAVLFLLVAYFLVGRMKKKVEGEELAQVENVEAHVKDVLKREMEEAGMKEVKGSKQSRKAKVMHELDDDLNRVVQVIKKEGGRTTQKELRKQIPLSEAKISLLVSELEHNKIVQKVKKGRGNIIILKKR